MLDVRLSTMFRFTDDCDWRSYQRVSGALAAGVLTFAYIEAIEPGQRRCAFPCSGTSSIAVR